MWLDTGTIDSMSEASAYVEVLQKRTGTVIGSPEVAAYREGFIDAAQLEALGEQVDERRVDVVDAPAQTHESRGRVGLLALDRFGVRMIHLQTSVPDAARYRRKA